MPYAFLYDRTENPFGRSWEQWAEAWCIWLFSIPKQKSPALDETGKYCSENQNDENVWFLTGTFGNIVPTKRECTIPAGKAILFPILVKEVSLVEDSDLKTETELLDRSRDATNRLVYMEANIDGQNIDRLTNYRAKSEVFDLTYPENNVYNVRPGLTRSACDGYWLFIKPLHLGKHTIHFKGETSLEEVFTLAQLRNKVVYSPIWRHINENLTFKLDVIYELTIE